MQLSSRLTPRLTSRFLFLLLPGCFTLTATAQPRETVEGIHYQALAKTVPTDSATDKIEVREIFWYGCQECSTLEPLMTQWRNGVTGDLVFARMPAIWNDLMALHAKIYYTGRALKIEDRINQAAFRALQEQNNPLRTEAQIQAFFLSNGVTAEAFGATWNSEAVTSAVQQAKVRTADYGVDKLPSVIMNGRYLITQNAKVFNHIELNIAVNNLIRNLREERRSDF
jgi:protein dithiol oxidoreductase (disulfide-forming)